VIGWLRSLFTALSKRWGGYGSGGRLGLSIESLRRFGLRPMLIDAYVLNGFLFYFIGTLAALVLLTEVFTFFELVSDMIKNQIAMSKMMDYLYNLAPKLIYDETPISVVVASLICFGILTKNNEVTAFKAGGFLDQRPYVLRSFFASQVLIAESQGKVAHAYTEFWLGHQGDITQRHSTLGRPRLTPARIEDMRAAYRRCEPMLSSYPLLSQITTHAGVLKTILGVMGYSHEELRQIDSAHLSVEDARELIRKKAPGASAPAERLVSMDELPGFLTGGWRFVSALGADRAVVRQG